MNRAAALKIRRLLTLALWRSEEIGSATSTPTVQARARGRVDAFAAAINLLDLELGPPPAHTRFLRAALRQKAKRRKR